MVDVTMDGADFDKGSNLDWLPIIDGGNPTKAQEHAQWEARLREGFNRLRAEPRKVRLPSPDLRFDSEDNIAPALLVHGAGDEAHILLNSAAVSSNMQTNAAAFEGWSLALRRWAGAQKVRLSWVAPPLDFRGLISPHQERLAYRAVRFAELFPDWFLVEGDVQGSRSLDPSSEVKRLLNLPSRRSGLRTASKAAQVDLRAWKDERQMECSLRHHPSLAAHFDIGESRRDQQFPVGVFGAKQGVSVCRDPDRIFPGGKGAIDLVCADGSRFWLFELKARDNIPLGGLSELIFYTSVLRDARRGHFAFASGAWADCDVTGFDVERSNEFVAVLLGDDIHPLLDDPVIWQELNRAVETNWNAWGVPRVEFRAAKVTPNGYADIGPWLPHAAIASGVPSR